jgi:hypothetical protein
MFDISECVHSKRLYKLFWRYAKADRTDLKPSGMHTINIKVVDHTMMPHVMSCHVMVTSNDVADNVCNDRNTR